MSWNGGSNALAGSMDGELLYHRYRGSEPDVLIEAPAWERLPSPIRIAWHSLAASMYPEEIPYS